MTASAARNTAGRRVSKHRGFEPGHEVEDWLAAEDQIYAALTLHDLQAKALLDTLGR